MELFRVSRNAWGQETLLGLSWELLWLFVGAAAAFMVAHALYRRLLAPDARRSADGSATRRDMEPPA
jgi:uncharacterized membrane protein YhhN